MNNNIRDWIKSRVQEKGITTVGELKRTFASSNHLEIFDAIWYNVEQGNIIFDDIYQSLLPNDELKDK